MAKAKYTKGKDGYFKTRVWDGTYDDVGRKRYVTIRSKKSSKDLENKVTEHNQKIKNREYIIPSDISFYDYAVRWESIYKASKEASTRSMYQYVIRKYFSPLESVKLTDIGRIHYQTVMNSAIGHPALQLKIKFAFQQVIKSAVADQYISANMMDIILGSAEKIVYKSKEKRVLTDYEKKALFSSDFKDADCALVYILYGCGLRKSEALALTRECIDLQKKTLTVKRALGYKNNVPYPKEPKSQHGFRTVPIPDIIYPAIRDYIENLQQDKLFASRNGGWLSKSAYNTRWKRIIRAMQRGTKKPIDGLTAHVFRHNYCTNLCYQIPTISIKHIAALLGDTEKVVMGVYNHMILEKEDVESALKNAFNL